jgi:hypothetical protein
MNAKVIQVIATEYCRGLGITDDPCFTVTAYHSLDGELLAEVDNFQSMNKTGEEIRLENQVRELYDAMDKTKQELELARAVNFITKPNPALENVLAKLRDITNFTPRDMAKDSDVFYAVSGVAVITFGDLRRWVESEKVTT